MYHWMKSLSLSFDILGKDYVVLIYSFAFLIVLCTPMDKGY